MVQALNEFRELVGKIHDLSAAQGLLGWDMETHMPNKGAESRSKQLATLANIIHELQTSGEMGTLIDTLRGDSQFKKLTATDQALVREVAKEYDRQRKLPAKLVQEMAETTGKAHGIWVQARAQGDFSQFAPILEKLVKLNRDTAEALGYTGSPYNALLDLYEPELTVKTLDPLFKQLRDELVPLVKAIQESSAQPRTDFLGKKYNTDKQLAFGKQVLTDMGFDFEAGRQDLAAHPFCSGSGPMDVRLTTRVFPDNLVSALQSSMHEGGHGLYEQGINPELDRTPLGTGVSLGIHESQSRMYENLVGRSNSFWKHYLPKLKKVFPTQLKGIGLNTFYAAVNEVKPSFIRVESDEVTYNLHVLLRYEIEKAIIEGDLKVKDIPHEWNKRVQQYLGITPENDAMGALQDVHWAHGSFGYFPTYTIGNMYSVQFFNAARKQIGDLDAKIARGNLKPLKEWLNKQIHVGGKIETPEQIVRRVTGEPLNATYFIEYVWQKFGEIYQLESPRKKASAKSKAGASC